MAATVALPSVGTAHARPLTAQRVYRLDWHEVARAANGPVLEFRIPTLSVDGHGWVVTASVKNRSKVRLQISRRFFALASYPAVGDACNGRPMPATSYKPALPRSLAPGATWTGQFSGATRPSRSWVRIIFAHFDSTPSPFPELAFFGSITDHVLNVASGRSTYKPGSQCP